MDFHDEVLRRWINDRYLDERFLQGIRESSLAKPVCRYVVLDDFFRQSALDRLIARHQTLSFSESLDRNADGTLLPYDSAVKFADENDLGADLFFSPAWHHLCSYFVHSVIREPGRTEVKLRYHRPYANGFWVHTDSADRSMVAISYFNQGWKASYGGLLQLWRVDEALASEVIEIESPEPDQRLDFLNVARFRTRSPGGGWRPKHDGKARDMVLIDQIVPAYNRIFVCDFQSNPVYHSVTPSNGHVRCGFVQWFY